MTTTKLTPQKIKVMFVCLGNICRSPLALYIFNDVLKQKQILQYFHTDSSATSNYNTGLKADTRSIQVGKNHNLNLSTHIAKQITQEDFLTYDYILCMDTNNLSNLNKIKPKNTTAKIHLITDFNKNQTKSTNIIDPYYLNEDAFEDTYHNLFFALNSFLTQITLKTQ
jgi:protein-tyrosine phosphatase